MAIATGTALAIAAATSAGGGLVKAKMQSNAAKKAAKAQEQGTQESTRYMQQGLGQLSQLYAPYINSGAGAIGTLGRLTTPGPGARFASPGPPNAMPQAPMGGQQSMPRGGPYLGGGGGYGPPGGWGGYGPPGGGMGGYPSMPGGPFGQMGPMPQMGGGMMPWQGLPR